MRSRWADSLSGICRLDREQYRRDVRARRCAGENLRVEGLASGHGRMAAHERLEYADFKCAVSSAAGKRDCMDHS